MVILLLMSSMTPSLASDHDCKEASILNMGIEAPCNGALIGIEQLRLSTLCAKETVPKLKVLGEKCQSLREREREFFQRRLKLMWSENESLTRHIEESSSNNILDRFLWGSAGVAVGVLAVLITL